VLENEKETERKENRLIYFFSQVTLKTGPDMVQQNQRVQGFPVPPAQKRTSAVGMR